VDCEAQARFVTIAGVLLEHAFADGVVDGGKSWAKKISRGRGVFRGDRGTQALHDGAHASGIRAVEFSAHPRLPGTF